MCCFFRSFVPKGTRCRHRFWVLPIFSPYGTMHTEGNTICQNLCPLWQGGQPAGSMINKNVVVSCPFSRHYITFWKSVQMTAPHITRKTFTRSNHFPDPGSENERSSFNEIQKAMRTQYEQ